MRTLFISTNFPIPANNGQAIRTLSVVQGLASIGHRVTFVSFAPAVLPATYGTLSSYCCEVDLVENRPHTTNMSRNSDYLNRLRCLLFARSYAIERFRSPAMRATIQKHLQTGGFDLLVCDSVYALENVPVTRVPIGLNCHNVEYLIVERYAAIEQNRLRKLYAYAESRLLRKAEQRSCKGVAFAMACSDRDRSMLLQLNPDVPVFVVPNAVDTKWCEPRETRHVKRPYILFQGGMDWYPNRDAVLFFASRILPIVRAEFPDLKFVIAGRNPPPDFIERFRYDPNIEFTGTVSDMRPCVSDATLVVVPLRLGSGTRLKILEACAAGKPVVSTTVGAEGLDLRHGAEILIADAPSDFARSVVCLLRDQPRRAEIAAAGRKLVTERYRQADVERSLAAATSTLHHAAQPAAPGPEMYHPRPAPT